MVAMVTRYIFMVVHIIIPLYVMSLSTPSSGCSYKVCACNGLFTIINCNVCLRDLYLSVTCVCLFHDHGCIGILYNYVYMCTWSIIH